ncbi:MAG: type II toxin-antitoxin system VapC family toxin [Oscillospiraceae bacterium]|nr:type II toxin-antitoxin system VapC family toxin [Oscillospiraceae bacterium]
MKFMLDTNICIYYINKKPPHVIDKVHQCMLDGICISVITLAELEYGIAKSAHLKQNADELTRFLSIFTVLDLDSKAATEYGTINADLQRKGTPISPMDTLIAAHAKSEGLILVTNNLREFERIEGLTLENWA